MKLLIFGLASLIGLHSANCLPAQVRDENAVELVVPEARQNFNFGWYLNDGGNNKNDKNDNNDRAKVATTKKTTTVRTTVKPTTKTTTRENRKITTTTRKTTTTTRKKTTKRVIVKVGGVDQEQIIEEQDFIEVDVDPEQVDEGQDEDQDEEQQDEGDDEVEHEQIDEGKTEVTKQPLTINGVSIYLKYVQKYFQSENCAKEKHWRGPFRNRFLGGF